MALPALALCFACSPVTLNASASDGGGDNGGNPDASPRPDAAPLFDAGETCQGGDDSCQGDTFRHCNNQGFFEDVSCELGCSTAGGAHCRQLHPALLGTPISASCEDAGDFEPTAELLFDTMTGAILNRTDASVIRAAGTGSDVATGIGFDIIQQGGATEVGIFTFGKLTVPFGRHEVRGQRVAAFIACGPMLVNGTLDAAADLMMPGPGGHPPTNAPSGDAGGPGAGGDGQPNLDSNLGESGGGGGGYGGPGGGGGNGFGNPLPQGGGRGQLYGNFSLLPLVGGSSGGLSGGGIVGGAGGGALYLASASSIFFNGGGSINVGGGGGSSTVTGSNGGGGGGAGGSIFLDAPSVGLIDGATLSANGGGGASHTEVGQNAFSGIGAAGPNRGGAFETANGDDGSGGGGGGGGCGRMRILSDTGAVSLADAVMSPGVQTTNSVGDLLVSQDIADIK